MNEIPDTFGRKCPTCGTELVLLMAEVPRGFICSACNPRPPHPEIAKRDARIAELEEQVRTLMVNVLPMAVLERDEAEGELAAERARVAELEELLEAARKERTR